MNYIRQFMRDNGLVPGQPFRISDSRRLWFCFADDDRLDLCSEDAYMRSCLNFEYILLRLLRGETGVSTVMGS